MNNTNKLEVPVQFRNVYRAFVEPPHDSRSAELTVFVEAISRDGAIRKISQAIALLGFGTVAESVVDRIYNLSNASELINDGLSENVEERLLETGWSGGKPTHFVEHPLVLMRDPTPLLNIWTRVSAAAEADEIPDCPEPCCTIDKPLPVCPSEELAAVRNAANATLTCDGTCRYDMSGVFQTDPECSTHGTQS